MYSRPDVRITVFFSRGFFKAVAPDDGRPRRRWEDNIKTDVQEVESGAWTGSHWLKIRAGGGHL